MSTAAFSALTCSRLFRVVVGCRPGVRVAFRSFGEVVSKVVFFRCSVFFVYVLLCFHPLLVYGLLVVKFT